MKKSYQLKYGKNNIEYLFEEDTVLDLLQADEPQNSISQDNIIIDSLLNPIGTAPLVELVTAGETVCIVVPDLTRSWQRIDFYLPYVVQELNKGGVRDEDIILLLATGTHRAHTDDEKIKLVGKELAKRLKIIDHDCNDNNNLLFIGKTTYETPLYINRIALEADHLILTGGIIFHDMAGFGGGRKSILPGIAGYKTIMANHSLLLDEEKGGIKETIRGGVLTGNPLHEDMLEAASIVNPSFILNVIINSKGEIAAAVAGCYKKAHQTGCEIVKKRYGIEIPEQADLVIASSGGYPKDINLYQGSKALVNAAYAAKDDGYIILLAECIEGIGHNQVAEIFNNFTNAEERENYLKHNFTVSRYIGYLITLIAKKHNILLVSDLESKVLNNTGIVLFKNFEDALGFAIENLDNNYKSYLIPDAANVMPVF